MAELLLSSPTTPTQRVVLPSRSRRFGVGKAIGGAVYLHRDYEHLLGKFVEETKVYLPACFAYEVIKYHAARETLSFVQSPDFDTAPEPTIGDLWIVYADGRSQLRRQLADPFIYHHKWLFVTDDYSRFDVAESKARSAAWMALPNVDCTRIGRRSYWVNSVVPYLSNSI